MAQERNYDKWDMDAAYNEGRRAAQRPGIGFANWIAIIAIIIMVGIMVATFIGVTPTARISGDQSQATPTPDTLAVENARLRALLAAPPEKSLVIQSVPAGAAPQVLTIATPIVPTPEPGATPELPPPAQQLIVVHEGGSAPHITGSGACKVAMGARRCGH